MGIAKSIRQGLAILGLATLAIGTPPAAAQGSLYDSVGGKPVIAKVVDDFVGHVMADPRIDFQFAKTNIRHLKAMLNDQLCAVLGGPCKYEGETMKNAHAGMNVTNAQFNALAEDLYLALEQNGVPYKTQNAIMAVLAPMQRDIVTR